MRALLSPAAAAYSMGTSLREILYRRGIFKSIRLSKPVVSVGNLTVGGTGKSPMVDILLTQLEAKNLRCCVLTRGYGRKSKDPLFVNEKTTTDQAGDEPVWLFQKHPQAIIAVGANRVESASKVDQNAVDVFILDDGLQHMGIHRDVEITLIDSTRPLWHYHSLPWGYAREGWSALKRSDVAILTRSNLASADKLDQLAQLIFDQGVGDVLESDIVIDHVSNVMTNVPLDIRNKKVFLVSAIANPESFKTLMEQAQAVVVGHKSLPDHHSYSLSEILILGKKAKDMGAECLLITEKDLIKWKEELPTLKNGMELPVGVVVTKFSFNPELPDFYDLAIYHRH